MRLEWKPGATWILNIVTEKVDEDEGGTCGLDRKHVQECSHHICGMGVVHRRSGEQS